MPRLYFWRRSRAAMLRDKRCWWTAESRRARRALSFRRLRPRSTNSRKSRRSCERGQNAVPSCRFGNRLHFPQEKNIRRDAEEKDRRSCHECAGIRVSCLYDVAGHDGRGNRGELIAEIEDSADGAYALFW